MKRLPSRVTSNASTLFAASVVWWPEDNYLGNARMTTFECGIRRYQVESSGCPFPRLKFQTFARNRIVFIMVFDPPIRRNAELSRKLKVWFGNSTVLAALLESPANSCWPEMAHISII
jgi:hypothetical protein